MTINIRLMLGQDLHFLLSLPDIAGKPVSLTELKSCLITDIGRFLRYPSVRLTADSGTAIDLGHE